MKKSKIIIPALGLIAVTAAASITGTVAWFTASRTGIVTAGEFAVVNVSDNLAISLAEGVGTDASDSGDVHTITQESGAKLTDASLDHDTGTAIPNIITPDVPREKVLLSTALDTANLGTVISRGSNVYSAFTWNMTFTVTFSDSATKNQGLFLDMTSSDTYMHEKVEFAVTEGETDHIISAAEAGTYYTNAKCTEGATTKAANEHITAGTWYKQAPDASGKGFRLGFIPTAIGGTGSETSMAYAKVWAAHDGSAEGSGKFVHGLSVGDALAGTAYDTSTISYNGAYAAATAGSGKVLIENTTENLPDNDTLSNTSALSGRSNYLGYFACDAGETVSLTYTVVAWFEGTHPNVVNGQELETMVTSMKFGVSNLTA